MARAPFIRPEAHAALMRWREVLIGLGVAALGLWWVFGSGGLMVVIGVVACFAGTGLAFVGFQRARFRVASGGPGSVDVDEGQIVYFGPMTGGAMALRDMTELVLLRTGVTTHWRLSAGSDVLYIPIDADGADALFDAFTTLPGLPVERMLAALQASEHVDHLIWQKTTRMPDQTVH